MNEMFFKSKRVEEAKVVTRFPLVNQRKDHYKTKLEKIILIFLNNLMNILLLFFIKLEKIKKTKL